MSNKKYEFTGESKQHKGITLKQIKRLSDGAIGGWIETEASLSHKGDCWVYDNAQVYGNALVYGNARVSGNALVYGDARVYGNALVYGKALVYGDARVYGDAMVYDNAKVYDNARVSGKAEVYGNAICTDDPYTVNLPKFNITVTDNLIAIGCITLPYEQWLEQKEALTKEHTLSKQEVELYESLVTLLWTNKKQEIENL